MSWIFKWIAGHKGSGYSGHHGHSGVQGRQGGSLPRGVSVIMSSEIYSDETEVAIYTIEQGANVPKHLRKDAILMLEPDGLLHASPRKAANGKQLMHGDAAAGMGWTHERFDSAPRAVVTPQGGVIIRTDSVGWPKKSHLKLSFAERDAVAEKRIRKLARRMVNGGFPPDTQVTWLTALAKKIDLPASDWKQKGATLAQWIND